MQTIWITTEETNEELTIPSSTDEVVDGVRWGTVDEFFTPAFWKCQAELHSRRNEYTSHRLGVDLREELAACLLGGYGIPAEMGLRAFARLKSAGLLDGKATKSEIGVELARPFKVGDREARYRFHTQKASYLNGALAGLDEIDTKCGDVALRDALIDLPGIGPKTASWIVRNHRASNEVAIIDIHLHRAGQMMNLFDVESEPTRHYFDLEARFLAFCKAMGVAASILDALIWDYMRRVGPTVRPVRQTPRQHLGQLSLAI
jgi:N-glycosylase/DNA lyase